MIKCYFEAVGVIIAIICFVVSLIWAILEFDRGNKIARYYLVGLLSTLLFGVLIIWTIVIAHGLCGK